MQLSKATAVKADAPYRYLPAAELSTLSQTMGTGEVTLYMTFNDPEGEPMEQHLTLSKDEVARLLRLLNGTA